ncbi:MAG TPA: class I adenylate-forming enzyme family protein [Acidimicrobiales bacterium]|nr:class I adenylate-forming enzyme family protein [Acidimicrobiales bacterium]
MTTRVEALQHVLATNPAFALDHVEVRGVPWRVYRNAPASMRAVLESTAEFGDRPFLVYEGERWSFAEHLRTVTGLAARWHGLGVGKGDRVAIAMRNYPEWVMAFWAAQAIGAVVVPLNAWWTADELAYGIRDATPSLVVADGERAEVIAGLDGLGADVPAGRIVAVRARRALPADAVAWADELAAIEPDAALPDVDIAPDDDCTIMYTSGTTGAPKGAVASQRNHLTNLCNTELNGAVGAAMAGVDLPPDLKPADLPQTSMLQTFPFFHIGGLSGLYVGTAFGAKVSLMYKWDTAEAADIIQREQVTAASMVPTLLRKLLDHAEAHDLQFETLSGMGSGGAPVPADLIRTIEHHFDRRVSPGNGYGLTETTSAIVVNSGTEYFEHPDSVGRCVPGADLRIVAPETGTDAGPGVVGELWFRGPNVVRGYWCKPDATAAAFTDGWFHTGDLGYVDEDGLVYVVDRLKDVIIRGGENVYCAEVETVLFEHAAVADVAVIGLPHRSLGEEVTAVVERHAGVTVSAADLQSHVAGRLAGFKVPSRVFFADEPLPRTATGKVLKRDLRDRYSAAPTAPTVPTRGTT